MEKSSKRIAFYGKGGIGKSTIAANVSAAFAKMGKRVLHIGCDPKADSTRCLMKKRIPTVIQRLNEKGEQVTTLDILFTSETGVACVEAGGPEAGIGCAGMGISSFPDTSVPPVLPQPAKRLVHMTAVTNSAAIFLSFIFFSLWVLVF